MNPEGSTPTLPILGFSPASGFSYLFGYRTILTSISHVDIHGSVSKRFPLLEPRLKNDTEDGEKESVLNQSLAFEWTRPL